MLDPELHDFIHGPVLTLVGTRSAELRPRMARGWAPRLYSDGESLELFIDRPSGVAAIANLRQNGHIAVTLEEPVSHKSIQLKGRCLEISDPTPDDLRVLEERRRQISDILVSVGESPETVRNMWSTQVVKVRCLVERAFDQTPGPGAGKAL